MIYLEETLNLAPATPMSLDGFIDFAQDKLLTSYSETGARLSAAWYSDAEYYRQVTQLLEFDDLNAFAAYRNELDRGSSWKEIEAELSARAPVRRYRVRLWSNLRVKLFSQAGHRKATFRELFACEQSR